MRISYSQIKAFQACQQAWQYSRRYRSRKPSKAMTLGSVVHACLTQWWTFNDYAFPVTEFEAEQISLIQQNDPRAMPVEMVSEISTTARWIMDRYAQVYTRDGAVVIEVEVEHIVPIGVIVVDGPDGRHEEVVELVFRPDMIVDWQGQRICFDFKTGAKFSAAEIIDLAPQLSDYLLGLWLEGAPADQGCFDLIKSYRWRKKGDWDDANHPPHESFQRHWTSRSTDQLERHRAELLKTAEQMFMISRGELGAVRSWGEAQCPRCFFKGPCFEYALGGPMGEQAILEESFDLRGAKTSAEANELVAATVDLDAF